MHSSSIPAFDIGAAAVHGRPMFLASPASQDRDATCALSSSRFGSLMSDWHRSIYLPLPPMARLPCEQLHSFPEVVRYRSGMQVPAVNAPPATGRSASRSTTLRSNEMSNSDLNSALPPPLRLTLEEASKVAAGSLPSASWLLDTTYYWKGQPVNYYVQGTPAVNPVFTGALAAGFLVR
jgi:hypothetical protein